MNPVWAEIARYAFYAVAAWAVCKYILQPIGNSFINDDISQPKADALKEMAIAYKEAYSKTIEERAKVVIEMSKEGESKEDISEILDETLPLPDAPEI